jgi:hypothetical protein
MDHPAPSWQLVSQRFLKQMSEIFRSGGIDHKVAAVNLLEPITWMDDHAAPAAGLQALDQSGCYPGPIGQHQPTPLSGRVGSIWGSDR